MNGGGRIEQAWNALQGVMPLASAPLAAHFPGLWKTAGAARADAREWVKEGRLTNIDTLSNPTLFKLQYRPAHAPGRDARQCAWSWCLSLYAEPEVTRKKLEVLLGVAVEMRGTGIPAAVPQPAPRRSRKHANLSAPGDRERPPTPRSSRAVPRGAKHPLRAPYEALSASYEI